MNLMQQHLARAAKELGLRVIIGYAVKLSDGEMLSSQALFPDLGNPKGTLVFHWDDRIDKKARQDLVTQEYGASTFGEPLPGQNFDVTSYARMFAEWGWWGDERDKPSWMSELR